MKIEYKFVTGAVEVEVSNEWGTLLVDMDRQEYNNDHKETRRHISLDACQYEGATFATEDFGFDAVLDRDEAKKLVAAALPRICFDRELPGLRRELEACREAGVTDAYVGNLGHVPLCKELGFALRGDFGLQVFNSQGVKEYKRLGFQSVTASFELKLAQIRDLAKAVDTEIIAYGRLPLMITENCAVKNQSGKCVCSNVNLLTDRKGVRFPVERAYGCRNEILNANKVFLADKAQDWKKAGLRAIRLLFTTENGVECVQVLEAYRGRGNYIPNNFTRGLYYRDVE